MAIKRVSIYDMDGTIVCSMHRYRTVTSGNKVAIDLAHWRENEPLAMLDSLLPLASQYVADLSDPECYVIIATARVLNDPDRQFIAEILGQPDFIVSRKSDDTQSGKTLKIKGLARFFNLVNFRNADFCFYEDNVEYLKAVCDKYNIRGIYIPSAQGH